MELARENGASLVHHALVAAVVEVDEVLLEVTGEGGSIDGITMVLAGDVALARGQIKRWDTIRSSQLSHSCGHVAGTGQTYL